MRHRRAARNLGKVASWSTRRYGVTPIHNISATLIKTMVVVVVKVKRGKGFPVHAMKIYKCIRSVAVLILNLDTR
jgi:hypothetical protein